MTLPKRPELSDPIPNPKINSSNETLIKGPYWYMSLGPGLESDGQGSVQITGSVPSEPSNFLYGPNGYVGLGTGLELGSNGELRTTGESLSEKTSSNEEETFSSFSKERKRARDKEGKFIGDDPSTPGNEAWVTE